MAKIEPANLLLKDKNGNTGLVKSLTNKDITTLKNVVTNVDYIKDFVNANGGSLPVQGDLKLTATDAAGKNGKTLLGTSSGTLQWNGKNIVRSVNGTNADANGNIAITSVANATKATQDKNGAQIDTTYFKSANGTFTGREYFRAVNDDVLRFNGGNTHDGGASLMLFAKNNKHAPGIFDLVACTKEDGTDGKQLIGTPAGSLTWIGQEIERVELKSGNYIRFASGLTLMWGGVTLPIGTKRQTVNLPIPFNSTYVVSLSNSGNYQANAGAMIGSQVVITSLSTFDIQHTWEGETGWNYFAVGY